MEGKTTDAVSEDVLISVCRMDQAASVLSLPQHALYISFHPKLQVDAIPLPHTSPPTVFIIANSLKVADKLVSSKIHYNLRVVETLVAARVLARGLHVSVGKEEKITLREVLDRWLGVEEGEEIEAERLEEGLERILEQVEGILGGDGRKDGLTMEEMIHASGLSSDDFNRVYLSWVEGTFCARPFYRFQIESPSRISRGRQISTLQTRETRFL